MGEAVVELPLAPLALPALALLTDPSLQDMNRLGGASRRVRVEGGQLGGDEWTRHGSFVNKPTRGWLHADNVVTTTGVSYTVRVSISIQILIHKKLYWHDHNVLQYCQSIWVGCIICDYIHNTYIYTQDTSEEEKEKCEL